MYRACPPALGVDTRPLRVTRARRRVFEGESDSARDPAFRGYMADLAASYGLSLLEDQLSEGRGQSYGEMAGVLIAQTVPAAQPVDLLVVAFAVSDVAPWRSTACYLSHLCPGNPMAFAVCDCGAGAGAAFTALRLIREYAGAGGCQRALLVVLEQAAVPHELAVPVATPSRHAAVTLLCDQAGPGLLDAVRLHAGVARSQAGGLLASGLADLADTSSGYRDVTVIAGAGLAEEAASTAVSASTAMAEVVIVPAGQPCTGVWWEVAGRLPGWAARGRRVLLADYDPLSGNLCLATIRVNGA